MEEGDFKIPLDGKWDIIDLARFANIFSQLYSFYYTLNRDEIDSGVLADASFSSYPWRGGFSTVNFFSAMYRNIRLDERINIKSIHYASPGELIVLAWVPACYGVVKLLQQFIKLLDQSIDLYKKIQTELASRKLKKQESKGVIDLSKDDEKYCTESFFMLAKLMGFTSLESNKIFEKCENPLAALKLLLSVFRRVRFLAEEFELKNKTNIT